MEMVKTDKKIYSLPAKVGAVMLSVIRIYSRYFISAVFDTCFAHGGTQER